MNEQYPAPLLELWVNLNNITFFTTIFQSGIKVKCFQGTTLGIFLSQFSGFTPEYISETVQTVFLNGTAIDDMEVIFSDKQATLALSASMPGLAGAILRRNSFHAALRTETGIVSSKSDSTSLTTVTLKLFNRIATERGVDLLNDGVPISSCDCLNFFSRRPHLFDYIKTVKYANNVTSKHQVADILKATETITLKIVGVDDKN